MDRRIQKTRLAIRQAYRELLQEKGIVITVQRICEAANVGRSTFYLHFTDRDNLPLEMCSELFEHVGTQTPLEPPPGESLPPMGNLLRDTRNSYTSIRQFLRYSIHIMKHLDRERAIYSRMFDLAQAEWFYQAFRLSLERFLEAYVLQNILPLPEDIPSKLYTNYLVDTFFSVLKWGYSCKEPCSPRMLGYYYTYLVMCQTS